MVEAAIRDSKHIQRNQEALDKEGLLFSGWSDGRSGDHALGRQIHGLWLVSRRVSSSVHTCLDTQCLFGVCRTHVLGRNN
jgi:hypothetical protein